MLLICDGFRVQTPALLVTVNTTTARHELTAIYTAELLTFAGCWVRVSVRKTTVLSIFLSVLSTLKWTTNRSRFLIVYYI
jgi:hypothetical protein